MRKPHVALVIMVAVALFLAGCGAGTVNKQDPSSANRNADDKVYQAVNTKDFKSLGKLAFILEGNLYVLNGETSAIIPIGEKGTVLNPKWSAGGDYLAFVTISDREAMKGSLWVAKSDGTQIKEIKGLKQPIGYDSYNWSPKNNTLAVCAEDGTYLADTNGNARILIKSSDYMSVVWSPDGKYLAYSLTLPYDQNRPDLRSDALYTIDTSSGKITEHFTADQAGIRLLSWWPDGKGWLYWLAPFHSASIAADGLDLYSLPMDGKKPLRLQNALPDQANLVQFSPDQLIMVIGSGREIYTNKQLALVDLTTGNCRKIPQPANSVVGDLALSPDRKTLAYASAKDLGNQPDSNRINEWLDAYSLWISAADGTEAREIKAAGTGIALPQWSNDNKHIVFLRNSELWLVDIDGSDAHKITTLSLNQADSKAFAQKAPASALSAWFKNDSQ